MSKEAAKKVLNILTRVFTCIVVAVTVFMMVFTVFSVMTFDRNDRNLFGIRFYIVQTDSMSPSENNKNDKIKFDAGDIVLIRSVDDNSALEPGQVIAFISQNSVSFGKTVTHMIKDIELDKNGEFAGYVTYGTNTGAVDEAVVEPEYVLGVYAGKLPKVGYFFQFLRTVPGYIICILVPFLLLILYQGVNTIRLFKRYKREQMADMEEERAQIAEERRQSAEMMRELQALREQLAQQSTAAPPSPTQPSDAPVVEPKDDSEGEPKE